MVNNNETECSIPGPGTVRNTNIHGHSNLNNRPDNISSSNNNKIKYFLAGPSEKSDKKASTEITKQLQMEFEDVFTGIGCFDGTFTLQVKPDSKTQQVSPKHIAYALQKLFKEEFERLQQQDIMTPLSVHEMAEWCNSFILIPKPNDKVRLCLEPPRLNQALIRLVHRGSTLNEIFPKLNKM